MVRSQNTYNLLFQNVKKTALYFGIYFLTLKPLQASPYDDLSWDQVPEGTPVTTAISCAGGGIRGLYTLHIMEGIQKHGGNIYNAKYYAGTSTGGMISLGIAGGMPLADAIDIYSHRGNELFLKHYGGWFNWATVLFNEKYSYTGIERVQKEIFGEDTLFSSLEPHVIIPSYDIEGGANKDPCPYIFDSKNPRDETVKIWEVARATSAAPTFFEPFYGIPGHSLVDGGIFANNPSDVVIGNILDQYDSRNKGTALNGTYMISLGTGGFDQPIPRLTSRNMGLMEWATPISSLMMQAVSEKSHMITENLLGDRYMHLDGNLDREVALDANTSEDINFLRDSALAYIEKHPEEIDKAVKILNLR